MGAKANWKEFRRDQIGRWYQWGDLRVCVGDPDPTWDEIYTARYDFCPHDIDMAIILPKKTEYVNIHPNCFHVHELKPAELPSLIL